MRFYFVYLVLIFVLVSTATAQTFSSDRFRVEAGCQLDRDYTSNEFAGAEVTTYSCTRHEPKRATAQIFRVTVRDLSRDIDQVPKGAEASFKDEFLRETRDLYQRDGLRAELASFKNHEAVEATANLMVYGTPSKVVQMTFIAGERAYTLQLISDQNSSEGAYESFKDGFVVLK